MVFGWLKDLLFTPKRREMLEIRDEMTVLDTRVRRLEGLYGVAKREQQKEEDTEQMQAAAAKAAAMMKEGKSMQEVIQNLVTENPAIALKLAKQFGFKL